MSDTEHLFSAFQEHKDVFRGETYDYLFSYALHWHELRCLSGSLGEFAGSTNDPRLLELVEQAQRCLKLLEKDFSALIRAITKRYVRKDSQIQIAAPTLELKLDSVKRWNSIPASMDTKTRDFGKVLNTYVDKSMEEKTFSMSASSVLSPSDLRVVPQMFSDSVELSRLDETCFMRDVSYCAKEDELADAWEKEFPNRPLVEPGTEKRMKPLIRRGIPHSLRNEVWSATTGASQLLTDRPNVYKNAIRDTFPSMQGVMDSTSANLVRKMRGVDPCKVPLFGGKLPFHYIPLNDHGMHQTKILLCVLAQNSHVEHCPMLPTIVAALLMYLPETKAYAAAKCLLNAAGLVRPHKEKEEDLALTYRYIPTTVMESKLATGILAALLKKKLPTIAKHFDKIGVDVEQYARAWFDSMFTDVLPITLMLDVLDVFFLEGSKILQRVGLAFLKICEKDLLKAASKEEVDDILHSKLSQNPELQNIMKVAFSFQVKRREMEDLEHALRHSIKVDPQNFAFRDGVYYRPAIKTKSKVIIREDHWETLFYWLAGHPGVPAAPWELAFSTWRDGFSLKTLYSKCETVGPSVLLIKALPHHESEHGALHWGTEVFGAFSSEPLKLTKEFYGTGTCFVFQLSPMPQRWNWAALQSPSGEPTNLSQLSESEQPEYEPRNEMFINGYMDHLVFGSGGEGPALDLAGDLQTATTYESATYKNKPLCSATTFDIQHLEVYYFDS